ncbi:DUF1989 domain-containing protein [Pantoea dispersa]|uniref:DUF1989 domain-containing protein n=1 Tax=Pantoea dispersa TaxID=59814 RepID=UPI0036F3B70E
MNTVLDEKGNLSVETPLSNAGDYVRLRAEMDLIVAIAFPFFNRAGRKRDN